jgi:DNA invertase Pin-like site-specific DNA recombinase
MIYGYARVSTAAQDLANQLTQLKAAGCERIFHEKITGANAEPPSLRGCWQRWRPRYYARR